jgi:hypothetical protein
MRIPCAIAADAARDAIAPLRCIGDESRFLARTR